MVKGKPDDDRVIATSRTLRRAAKDQAEAGRQADFAIMKGELADRDREAYVKGWLNRGFYR